MAPKKTVKSGSALHLFIGRIFAGLAVLGLCIVLVSGIRAGVSLATINVRGIVVVGVVFVIGRVLLRVLRTYEEISRG